MNFLRCLRRDEITAATMRGQWPDGCPEELRAHVKRCRRCAEVVLITQTLRSARGISVKGARLEPAGLIWWRAQIRKRRDVMERLNGPMWQVQTIAVGSSVCVAMAFVVWMATAGGGWRSWTSWLAGLYPVAPLPSAMTGRLGLVTAISGALLLSVLGGIAVSLAVERRGSVGRTKRDEA
jgi:hypothetical protein